jgi:hypothetical protein
VTILLTLDEAKASVSQENDVVGQRAKDEVSGSQHFLALGTFCSQTSKNLFFFVNTAGASELDKAIRQKVSDYLWRASNRLLEQFLF